MEEVIIEMPSTIDAYWHNRNYIKYYLDQAKGKSVRLKCSCYGGDVAEAVAISNSLVEHGDVTVEFIGFNASAATWLAFGAKAIEIHADAMWLAHKCSYSVDYWGALNSDNIEDKIKELQNLKKSAEAIDLLIAKKYADRCKKSIKNVLELMSEERWMSADEVMTWKFADKLIPGINKSASSTNLITNEFAAMGLPIPVIQQKTEQQNDSASMIEKILDGVKNLLKPKENNIPNNLINATMNKTFVTVNQILNVEGLAENDGKITLTIDQVKALNDGLKAANDAKTSAEQGKTAAETSLNNVIEGLDNLSPSVKAAADNTAKIQVISDTFKKVPGVLETPKNEGGEDKYKDIAKDPINSFAND